MDFLPESKDRDGVYDMLTVIIDHLTGMVHLVPSRMNYKAKDVAELVFSEVYKYHGLPKAIVSDRDTLFTSIFWSHLHKLIGTKLKMSSAYHPETDGLTERSNRTVGAMLRQVCSRRSERLGLEATSYRVCDQLCTIRNNWVRTLLSQYWPNASCYDLGQCLEN